MKGSDYMTKKKKILLCCLAVVLVLLVVAGAIVYAKLPHALNYPIEKIEPIEHQTLSVVSESDDTVTLQKNDAGAFKVLMFTDQHLDGNNKTSYKTVDRMVDAIRSEQPDLVLVGGDNVTSGLNKKRANQFAQIFEQLGVYWGGVLGNHEGDNPYSIKRSEMVDIFATYDHCVMRKGPEEIDGDCNYVIRLLGSDGKLMQTVFCLDTFDEIDEETAAAKTLIPDKSPYDGAHENQIRWYRETAAALKETDGSYKSILLQHIPLPAYDKAIETEPFLYGDKRENICSTCYENGLFAAIKETGVTQTVFCGHDHLNNFGVDYEGILLSYIEPSGYGAYGLGRRGAPESEWLQGYTVLDLLPDGTFSQRQERYATIYND